MTTRPFQKYVLAVVGAVALVACSSGRGETVKAEPEAAKSQPEAVKSEPQAAPGPSPDPSPPAAQPCQPHTCLSLGKRCGQVSDGCGGVMDCGRCSRCGPDELDCCGTCIPRSEKRCPDNVHCSTSPPEM